MSSIGTWTVPGGKLTSMLGGQAKITIGASNSTVLGLSSAITLGNKHDLVLEPLLLLDLLTTGLGKVPKVGGTIQKFEEAARAVRNVVFGRNEFILSAKNEVVAGEKVSLILGGKKDITWTVTDEKAFDSYRNSIKGSKLILEKLCKLTSLLGNLSLLYLGFAGQKIVDSYTATADPTTGATASGAWSAINTSLLLTTALVGSLTLGLAMATAAAKAELLTSRKEFYWQIQKGLVSALKCYLTGLKGSVKQMAFVLLGWLLNIAFVGILALLIWAPWKSPTTTTAPAV